MKWKRKLAVSLCAAALLSFGCNDDDEIDVDDLDNNEFINNDFINNDFINNDFFNNDFFNNDEFDNSEEFLGDPADEPLTLDAFESQFTRAVTRQFCQSAFECPESQPLPFIVSIAGRFGDLETCMDNYNPGINSSLLATQRALIDGGTLRYDARRATDCLNELQGALETCSEFVASFGFDDNNACNQVFVSQLSDGEACVHDLECNSQNCVAEQDVCGGVCGTPMETAEEDTSCATAGCDDGLVCVFDGSGDLNRRVCLPPRTLERGSLCFGSSERCTEGLVCGFDGTCTDSPTFVESGESCNQLSRFCAPGLACHDIDANEVSSTGTCGAHRRVGEACQLSEQCLFGMYCDTSAGEAGSCQTQRQASEGCTGLVADECTTGLFCNRESGAPVCDTLIVEDSACVAPAD